MGIVPKGKTYEEVFGPEKAAEYKQQRREKMAQKKLDPGYRQALRDGQLRRYSRPEEHEKHSRRAKELGIGTWKKPGLRTKTRTCLNYDEWREAVIDRDGNRCIDCGATEGDSFHKLTAHHLIPWSTEGADSNFDINNGVALCNSCHAKRHRSVTGEFTSWPQ
jgi:5-methylcytosine-specific restriction endonuclease McrA